MPRSKAYQMSKDERASLARKKREETSTDDRKPVNTPTFSDAKEIRERAKKKKKLTFTDKFQLRLSVFIQQRTPVHRHQDEKEESSSLPTEDTAQYRRPSPDSPNLKYRNLTDRSLTDAHLRTGKKTYVHDSAPEFSARHTLRQCYANNSSALSYARHRTRRD